MRIEEIKSLFVKHKETRLFHRYIANKHILPLLLNFKKLIDLETIGSSVLGEPIYGLKIGNGNKRVLMWSQMHGNESTTTKALFDLLNTLLDNELKHILEACTLYIIPILNPDGANAYTRVNANEVDLNRDAQNLSQPESKVLRGVFNAFKPHFCYNLHGQRTIFSAGKTNKLATVSFLAPAQDEICTITPTRKVAMEVIGVMSEALHEVIPNQIGVYDDAFNINCVGDSFQCKNVPTILFEAGHYHDDYERESVRALIYISYVSSLDYISKTDVDGSLYETYFKIPENGKCFLDVIIRNAEFNDDLLDIGIQYQERLIGNKVEFMPKVVKIEKLKENFGHIEIDAKGFKVFGDSNLAVDLGYENVFVIINNEKIALFSK